MIGRGHKYRACLSAIRLAEASSPISASTPPGKQEKHRTGAEPEQHSDGQEGKGSDFGGSARPRQTQAQEDAQRNPSAETGENHEPPHPDVRQVSQLDAMTLFTHARQVATNAGPIAECFQPD
jgi:hypothetical protein